MNLPPSFLSFLFSFSISFFLFLPLFLPLLLPSRRPLLPRTRSNPCRRMFHTLATQAPWGHTGVPPRLGWNAEVRMYGASRAGPNPHFEKPKKQPWPVNVRTREATREVPRQRKLMQKTPLPATTYVITRGRRPRSHAPIPSSRWPSHVTMEKATSASSSTKTAKAKRPRRERPRTRAGTHLQRKI